MKTNIKFFIILFVSLASLSACAGIPKGAEAIKPFDAQKYLGKWYEIARFDFKFERNLNNTTATYSMNADGTIQVKNRGYNYIKKKWSDAKGVAKFVGDKTEARLKVSFFGPFYGGYNVIGLDADYKYALVVGNNVEYMWILSREKKIPDDVKQNYLTLAHSLGFETDKLIWVKHDE